jgi:hypothetical protein
MTASTLTNPTNSDDVATAEIHSMEGRTRLRLSLVDEKHPEKP